MDKKKEQTPIPRLNPELRKKMGLTQKQLAVAIGVDRSTVTKWESSASPPAVRFFPKIAEVLNCKISEILI